MFKNIVVKIRCFFITFIKILPVCNTHDTAVRKEHLYSNTSELFIGTISTVSEFFEINPPLSSIICMFNLLISFNFVFTLFWTNVPSSFKFSEMNITFFYKSKILSNQFFNRNYFGIRSQNNCFTYKEADSKLANLCNS